MKHQFRAVIVGCGKIAGGYDMPRSCSKGKIRTHIKAYLADPRFKVVAACDTDRTKLNTFCRHWKIPAAYMDLVSMLRCEKPDVVSICTPMPTHFKVISTVAQFPVRFIFAEKPFTGNLRQARKILDLLRCKKIAVAVNYIRRWCPNHQRVKRIIDSGKLGSLRSVNTYYPGDLLNIGSHLIDLIIYFAGEVTAVRAKRSMVDREEGELFLKKGAIATLQHGKIDNFILELLFEHGLVKIERYGYSGECVRWREKNHSRVCVEKVFRFASPNRGIDFALAAAVRNIGDHLMKGRKILSGGENTLKTLTVCEALRRSARHGQVVKILRSKEMI